jgi:hypothetical protein
MKKKMYVAILLGSILAIPFGTQTALADMEACTYQYCDQSQNVCKANYNQTNCYGAGGKEPCSSSRPCN